MTLLIISIQYVKNKVRDDVERHRDEIITGREEEFGTPGG